MIRILFRHFREAVLSVTRNFGRSFLSITTVGLILLLMSGFATVLLNVNKMAQDATSTLEVNVYVDSAASDADIKYLESQLKNLPQVTNVRYSSKDDQLAAIVEKYPSFNLFQNDTNPLLNAFIISLKDGEQIKTVSSQVKSFMFVYKVNDGGDITDKLVAFSNGFQFWGLVLIAVLVFIAIILIMNTIRSTIISRHTEISIMRLVGATKWFIRWPFLIEGALIGLLGSVLPAAVLYFGYEFIYAMITPQLVLTQYSLLPSDPYAWIIALSVMMLGVVVGAVGSVISIRRFLKR
ncbi:permease-like cell division protein FtsX [Carnobacteriaceae bacterium zg-ZUI252]|nr:permease-like cell division protein FtsX [Carnobacteriaceae bacterium zg-ZUI252]MBS4769992.1 permease-like cell division protein FtsX [Carnobacteriaceae bacterium zg-ZUI240]QTU83213.1 permease-like cell division protein FtsX [Carnobacteriaceae bacterium zg-C25]